MIRKDNLIHVGPIRITCTGNTDGRCSVVLAYDGVCLGTGIVAEEVLEKLKAEGIIFERTDDLLT